MTTLLRLLRIAVAALLGWLLALASASVLAGLLQGADAAGATGLGHTALRFPIPTAVPPAGISQLAPIEPSFAPWAVRVTRGVRGEASGTLVRWNDRTLLLTASHVVHFFPIQAWAPPPLRPPPVYSLSADGTQRDLAAGRTSYWWDVAVFPASGSPEATLALRQGALFLGETVRFTGYPSGAGQPWAASGEVVAVTPHQNGGAAAIVATVAPQVGQSGGALTDAAGRLVGIGVASTRYGVLAVGNGALAEVLAGRDRLPATGPPQPALWLAWILATGVAIALTVAIDGLIQRRAS